MLGTAALLFMPHPGSPLLPFSRICQALFDADPFPVRVRFLLFQGSSLQNLAPPAFSCFLSKRKCCFASVFFFFFPHLLWDKSGTHRLQNFACVGQVLISKNEKSSLKRDTLPFGLSYTSLHTHTAAARSQTSPHWFCILYSNAPPLSDQPWWCVLVCGHLRPRSEVFPWCLST